MNRLSRCLLLATVAPSLLLQPAMAQVPHPQAQVQSSHQGSAGQPGGPSSVLGAGDVLQITLPGEEAFKEPFHIGSDGRIDLPEVGAVDVGNLTLAAAKERIRSALSVSYRDLGRLGLVLKEHRIHVAVLGNVANPGQFDLPAAADVQQALGAAGGIRGGAQLDHLQLQRGGATTEFNYKSFLETGSPDALPPLRQLDTIFVPSEKGDAQGSAQQGGWLRTAPENAVGVMGAVRSPGRLQWSDQMSILDLLAQVNGATERADLQNVQILSPDGKKAVFNLQDFIDHGGKVAALPHIHGGTTVVVPDMATSPQDDHATWLKMPANQSIYLFGNVGRPGRYAFDPKLSFLDILSAADGPNQTADILNIRIMHRGEGHDRVTVFNLARYFQSGDDHLLPQIKPGDAILVPDRNRNWLEVPSDTAVRVLGAVGRPGRYQISNGMTILDLLAEAGGPNGDALQNKIIVVNLSGKPGSDQAKTFDLPAFAQSGDFRGLPLVRAGDTVYVPNQGQSDWRIFFDGLRDVLSVVSMVAIVKLL